MICKECGTIVPDEAKFCAGCGKAIESDAAVQDEMQNDNKEVTEAQQTDVDQTLPVNEEDKMTKIFSIVSLAAGITSVLSFCLCCCCSCGGALGMVVAMLIQFALGAGAIATGIVARKKGDKSPMSLIGFILGIFTVSALLIYLLIVIVMVIIGGDSAFMFSFFQDIMEDTGIDSYSF